MKHNLVNRPSGNAGCSSNKAGAGGLRAAGLALLLGSLALFQSGCAALVVGGAVAAGGVGTYAYLNGELKSTEPVALDRAWKAGQAAIKDLQFTPVSAEKDALTGKLVSRTAAGKQVQVLMKNQGEQLTEIRIRVGTFGDESVSRLVLEKIKSRF